MAKDLYQVKLLISTVDGGQYPCLASSICFEDSEAGLKEAKQRVNEIQTNLAVAMQSQLVSVGPGGKPLPLGVTMFEVLKHFGIAGIQAGVVKTPVDTSSIVEPGKPNLIVMK